MPKTNLKSSVMFDNDFKKIFNNFDKLIQLLRNVSQASHFRAPRSKKLGKTRKNWEKHDARGVRCSWREPEFFQKFLNDTSLEKQLNHKLNGEGLRGLAAILLEKNVSGA